jgi:hypothetical protein
MPTNKLTLKQVFVLNLGGTVSNALIVILNGMNLISDLALLTSRDYVAETLNVDDEVINKCLLTNTSKNFLQLLSKTVIKLYKSIGFRETHTRL